MMEDPVRAVILAGGSGTRLWPLSRLQAPKQFLKVLGDETLLEATVRRLSPLVSRETLLVVAGADMARGEGYHLLEPYEKILEPVARNTAAAIGVAALHCTLRGEDPILVVLPSDHVILDVPAFHAALEAAIESAREGRLVTFGVVPQGPATGYGYMLAGETRGRARQVLAFREKPNAETARRYLEEGGWYWNSGMFVWRASVILDALRQANAPLAAVLDAIAAQARSGRDFAAAVRDHFAAAPSISIDHGVLEHSSNVVLVPGDFGWSDVGSWDSVYDISTKDADGNALSGNVLALDCRNTHVHAESRLVAAVGVEDISVIETADAILVSRRSDSERVKEAVALLRKREAPELIAHVKVNRPWGSYTVLEGGPGYKIKRIEVAPGARLSLQSHVHRSEHWVVVSGVATVSLDGRESTLGRNESTYVPAGSRHRLENRGAEPLHIIEVQVGERVDEDDITRYDDQYGR